MEKSSVMLNIYQEDSYWCGHAEPRSGLDSEVLVMTAGCWIAPCRKRRQSLPGKGWMDSSIGRRWRASVWSVPTEAASLAGASTGCKIAVLNPFMCLRSHSAARLGKGSVQAVRLYSPFCLKYLGKCPQITSVLGFLEIPSSKLGNKSRHAIAWGNLHLTSVFLKRNKTFLFF